MNAGFPGTENLRPVRRLAFSADQGWTALCKFLGVAVPATAVPDTNDPAQIEQRIAAMSGKANAILAIVTLAAAGLIYGLVGLAGA